MGYLFQIQVGQLEGLGWLANPGSFAPSILTQVISSTIGAITAIGLIWFVIKVIIGAVGIINSGGDKAKIAEARNNIFYGIIGFVVLVSAMFIISLVLKVLGLEQLLVLEDVINTISP